VTTDEPEQLGQRRVVIREQTQPYVLIGYHRGSMRSDDDPVYDVLANVLGQGRTSRLYRRLVETETALNVQAVPSFPGEKHESLFVFFGLPNRGVSPDTVEHAIYEELDRIQEEGVTEEELERAKTQARSSLIGTLDSNSGLARRFARAEALTGDWRSVFRRLAALQAVTAGDVQRVARSTFERSNRTVAMIKTSDDEDEPTTAEN
jgi:predicted Zn-dependent peptidase